MRTLLTRRSAPSVRNLYAAFGGTHAAMELGHMSIYTALRAGVSGLTANSSALAVISDNIANVNTVGYKRSGVDF